MMTSVDLRRSQWRDRMYHLVRSDRALLIILVLHLVGKVGYFTQEYNAPLIGDETSYVNGGMALSNALRDLAAFDPVDVAELQRNVVSSGWFMPGMMLLMAPFFLVFPEASIALTRGYLGLASTLLLIVVVLAVRKHIGRPWAFAVAAFCGLTPMWSVFSFGAWGDLTAGLVLTLLLCQAYRMSQTARAGQAPTLRHGLMLGVLAISVVYFRSSAVLAALAMCAVAFLVTCVVLRGRDLLRATGAYVAAGCVFLGLLAPWSLAASVTLGDRVITTTSVSNVRGNTFGERDELCFGPCDPGSTIWFNPVRYSREVARATGLNELEVQALMSEYARRDVTAGSYARSVLENTERYFTRPAGFDRLLVDPKGGWTFADTWVTVVTSIMFFPVVALGLVSLVWPRRRPMNEQIAALAVKTALVALLVQPFVHIAGARYWTTAAPFFAMAAWLLLSSGRTDEQHDDVRATSRGNGAELARNVTVAHYGVAGIVVATVIIVCGLAAWG